jgi:methylaspartate ammonia-lyase
MRAVFMQLPDRGGLHKIRAINRAVAVCSKFGARTFMGTAINTTGGEWRKGIHVLV